MKKAGRACPAPTSGMILDVASTCDPACPSAVEPLGLQVCTFAAGMPTPLVRSWLRLAR